jgi:hypothetical protein
VRAAAAPDGLCGRGDVVSALTPFFIVGAILLVAFGVAAWRWWTGREG